MLLAVTGGCHGNNDSIEGEVRVTNGGPLPSDVPLKLEIAENVVVGQQMVGVTGKFAFHGLKDEHYQIVVTAQGYHPETSRWICSIMPADILLSI
jgi:hypothetical protein